MGFYCIGVPCGGKRRRNKEALGIGVGWSGLVFGCLIWSFSLSLSLDVSLSFLSWDYPCSSYLLETLVSVCVFSARWAEAGRLCSLGLVAHQASFV